MPSAFLAPRRGDYGWMTPDLVLSTVRSGRRTSSRISRHGISKNHPRASARRLRKPNTCSAFADATEWVAGVVGWIDFEEPSHRKHLEASPAPEIQGCAPDDSGLPDDDWMLPGADWAFRALIETGVHFEALGFRSHLDNFLTIFRRYPELSIVIDHAMKPQIRDDAFEPGPRKWL